MPHPDLDALIAEVLESSKYRWVSPELVRRIGERELHAHRRLKDAVKETRNKLHQVGGSYQGLRPEYAAWLSQLRAAQGDEQAWREACLAIMQHHASTRERLPVLEALYAELFGQLPEVRRVLDLACGLNPLALPWMPLGAGVTYMACDIYADMVGFVGEYLQLAGVPGRAWVCDLVSGAPGEAADLALALKLIPVLEQVEKGAGQRLLQQIDAPAILVSFPAQSLGGRQRGMAAHYTQLFERMVAGQSWGVTRLSFVSELAFLVRK